MNIEISYLHGTSTAAGKVRRPAAQSKPRELRPRARAACFVPVMATNMSAGILPSALLYAFPVHGKGGFGGQHQDFGGSVHGKGGFDGQSVNQSGFPAVQ